MTHHSTKKILWNLLSVFFLLAVFYFLGREFLRNWEQIRTYDFDFNTGLLIIASFTYFLAFLVFSIGWHCVLAYLHHPISFTEILLYFCITQPAKYIPGKIGLPVARMKFCHSHGVPHSITLLSTGIEGAFEILTGTALSLIAIFQIEALRPYSPWGVVIITIGSLTLLIPSIFYFFINLYLRIVRRDPIHKNQWVAFPRLLALLVIYLAGMFFLGLSQVFFLQSLSPVAPEHLPLLLGVAIFSMVASIIVFFAPAGLGIREGIWYLTLKPLTAPHVAFIYSFISRLWMIVIEALLVFVSIPILWIKKRRGTL